MLTWVIGVFFMTIWSLWLVINFQNCALIGCHFSLIIPICLDNTTLLHCDGQVVGQLYASTQAHHWWSKILRTFHDCIYWLDVLWNKYTGYCVQLYYGYKRMRFEWTHYELIVIHLLSPIKTQRHCPEFHVDAILCYFKLSLNNPDVQFNEYLAK